MTEGIDYYLESGKYVFTAHFLKSRGYCCGSGCRHCPYKENDSDVLDNPSPKDLGNKNCNDSDFNH